MSNKINKQIFLENLPRKGKSIDWKESANNKYKVHFIYDDIEGDINIIDFTIKNKNTLVKVKYNNIEMFMATSQLKGCSLGKLLNKYNGDFKVEIGTAFKDDKRDIIITGTKVKIDNKGIRRKYYKYICNKCGYSEGFIEESHLIGKHIGGCSACCKTNCKPVLGINTIYDTDKWMIPIIGEEIAKTYTHSSDFEIYPKCPSCNKIRDRKVALKTIYLSHSTGCPCGNGKSYCEKFAFNLLEQLDVEFIPEYSPNWIGKRRYDFYFKLNDKEYILEMDGRFHTEYNELSEQSVKESQIIDDYKDEMAKIHNIEVIRINCNYPTMSSRFKFIKQNILINEALNKLFDLSKIDWNKCNEYAISNLMNLVYDLWNNGMKDIEEIIKETKLSESCIRSYLRRGSIEGLCDYEIKALSKVSIYKNNEYINTFENVNILYENSIKLFGVQFNKSNIYTSCRTGKPYKGYNFKLLSIIEDLD